MFKLDRELSTVAKHLPWVVLVLLTLVLAYITMRY